MCGGKIGLWKIKDQVEVESNIEERRITKKRGRTDEIEKNEVLEEKELTAESGLGPRKGVLSPMGPLLFKRGSPGVPFWGPYSVTDTVTFRGGEHRNFSGGMKKQQNFESKNRTGDGFAQKDGILCLPGEPIESKNDVKRQYIEPLNPINQ